MGPLEGIRVVELSTGVAGPVAGMLLADYGAEVVKVEPPAGDPARKLAGFAVWNRGKQSVVVDGGSEAGRARLAGLLAAADVCIYADPAPIDAALGATAGAGTGATHAKIPGLVRLAMPPFVRPEDGCTPWAGGAESHELLAAAGGASSRQASFDGGPIHLVYPFAFYEQGIWAAACAVAALVERRTSGLGQTVTVAGIHGVLACTPGSFTLDPTEAPLPTNVGAGGRHPCYSTFKCGDGKWLFMAALTPKFQANAFKILGVGNLFADPRIDNNPRRLVLPENRPWVRALLEAAFATRSRDEWLEALEIGDCPAGPMYDRDAWLDHPQVVENGLRVEVDDPERGHVTMPGIAIGLGKTPGAVRSPAPRLGEHNESAGTWNGSPTPGPSPVRGGGEQIGLVSPPPCAGEGPGVGVSSGPLAGVRVLDLGTILAGPYAGNLLAGLGADVVKVEAPAGDAFRETGFVYNRGMRGLAIDLSRPSGQQAFHALVKTVDIVIDNSRGGVSQRLRFDYATLAEVNPKIITLSIAGFGERGPFSHKPAFDPVLQAMSGMMTAQGGDSDPGFYTIPVNDVAAAVTTVLGVCLALYHRGQSGEGQRTWTSLVASSLTMQSGELVRYEGRPPALRGGRDFAGPSPEQQFYPVSDGWVRVQAPSLAVLGKALGLEGAAQADAEAIASALAASTRAAVLERLHEASVPATPARHTAEVVQDPAVKSIELLEEHRFPNGRPYLVPHRYARFSRTEQAPLADAPGVGEHSREVLTEAGLSAEEIDALVRERVVIEGAPFILTELINYR